MSAAAKALDALEAALGRATKRPWLAVSLGTEAGRNVARGKTRVAGTHPQEGIVTATNVGGTSPSFDAELIARAVNLSAPLAAVARAAMARRDAIAALRGGVFNESNYRDLQTAKSRVEYCDAKLDAALDALEAAAMQGGGE